MKKIFYVLAVLALSLSSIVLVFKPAKTSALGDLILSCSNGFYLSPQYQHLENHTVRQLVDVRLDQYYIDAVYVRISSFNGSQASVTAQFIKRDGPIIASKTLTAPSSTAWVGFDFTDAPIPRGVYYIQVSANSGQAGWEKAGSNCIDESFAVVDGASQDFDLGFGLYAYDTSTSQNPSGGNGNNGSGNQGSGITPTPTTNSTGSSGTTGTNTLPPGRSSTSTNSQLTATPTSSSPSDADILGMFNGGRSGLPGGWLMFLGSSWLALMFSLISLLFLIGFIILIIFLVRRSRRKTDSTQTPSHENIKAKDEPSEKTSEQKK